MVDSGQSGLGLGENSFLITNRQKTVQKQKHKMTKKKTERQKDEEIEGQKESNIN